MLASTLEALGGLEGGRPRVPLVDLHSSNLTSDSSGSGLQRVFKLCYEGLGSREQVFWNAVFGPHIHFITTITFLVPPKKERGSCVL